MPIDSLLKKSEGMLFALITLFDGQQKHHSIEEGHDG